MDPISLRDAPIPTTLIVVRLGVATLADERLRASCERCHVRWGFWGFSLLEVPGGDDYQQLVRLRPEVGQRRQFLLANGHDLASDGFPLLPTLDYPHWSVAVAEPTTDLFARVRSHFVGPVKNPAFNPPAGGTIVP